MKIAITGADGFIGPHLQQRFARRGDTVVALTRSDFSPLSTQTIQTKLTGCHVVINLAGASIAKRWSKSYKQLIISSRVDTTHRLVEAINTLEEKPRLLISASAVGYYPQGGPYTEQCTTSGSDFLAQVCVAWEEAAHGVDPAVRLAITRFGVVLARDGGAFPSMLRPFQSGLGTKIGAGDELFSWIHIEDLLRGLLYLIEHTHLEGLFNLTAPQSTTNKQFNQQVARHVGALCCVPVPSRMLELILGEGAAVVSSSISAQPERLLEEGFRFRYPTLESALEELTDETNTP